MYVHKEGYYEYGVSIDIARARLQKVLVSYGSFLRSKVEDDHVTIRWKMNLAFANPILPVFSGLFKETDGGCALEGKVSLRFEAYLVEITFILLAVLAIAQGENAFELVLVILFINFFAWLYYVRCKKKILLIIRESL